MKEDLEVELRNFEGIGRVEGKEAIERFIIFEVCKSAVELKNKISSQ